MPQTLCLHGINFADGTDKLINVRWGTVRIYNSSTAVWDYSGSVHFDFSANIDTENFLDHAFFVNGVDSNYTYNSSGTWSGTTNVSDSPIAKYIKEQDVRLYLGNIKIRGTSYPSRVWWSDYPENNSIVWGLETGTNLVTTASSAVVTSTGSTFLTNNIKVGDKLTIENGTDAGEYTVRTIDSETQLTLTETLTTTDTNLNFWVGGNYFDVKTDNGDVITGFGQNSSELLIFKRLSLHRYNTRGGTLRQERQVPGTGSNRSIVNWNDFTYYHDPTSKAIRRYDSSNGALIISNAVEDLLENMGSAMIDNVVGYVSRGKDIEFYIGDTTTRDGISISDCVLVWDTVTQTWSTRSVPSAIEQSTVWIQSSQPDTYIGTQEGKVLKVNSGYQYDTTDIGFELTDSIIFPVGDDALVDFRRIRLYIENGQSIQAQYRLIYAPITEERWGITDWFPMQGSANSDKVEFTFRDGLPKRASGIQMKFIESSGKESFLLEKYIIYYSIPSNR